MRSQKWSKKKQKKNEVFFFKKKENKTNSRLRWRKKIAQVGATKAANVDAAAVCVDVAGLRA